MRIKCDLLLSPDKILLLFGAFDYIEGRTRIQKYGFLLDHVYGNNSLKWKPDYYGPFSPKLKNMVDDLESQELLTHYDVKNNYGYDVPRYTLTCKGYAEFLKVSKTLSDEYDKVKKILKPFHKLSLTELLQNIYLQYPSFTINSKIKDKIIKLD